MTSGSNAERQAKRLKGDLKDKDDMIGVSLSISKLVIKDPSIVRLPCNFEPDFLSLI